MAADPFADAEEPSKPMTVHIGDADYDLIERFAAYRNGLARAKGSVLRRQWSRKSMTEHFISIQCAGLRAQLAAVVSELGPLPDAEDVAAIDEYARKAIDHEAKAAAAPVKKK